MEEEIKILTENSDLTQINEMFISVKDHLPTNVELSIYYPKLKQLLHSEIFSYCKEKRDIKEDLNILRMSVGDYMSEKEIREYLDTIKNKYNNRDDTDIALDYHIEATRIDYGVAVFVIIKRSQINMKKFVFRFRKKDITTGIADLTTAGIPLDALKGGE